jgi:hypothetical protein
MLNDEIEKNISQLRLTYDTYDSDNEIKITL